VAEGTEAPYQPNHWRGRPEPLPDEMKGSKIRKRLPNGEFFTVGHVIIRPNDPAPPHDPVPDMRPDRLLEAAGFESAEDWGNSILARRSADIAHQAMNNGVPPRLRRPIRDNPQA
jgi:hypothetical protein